MEVPRFVRGRGEIWEGRAEGRAEAPAPETPLESRLLLGLVSAIAAAVLAVLSAAFTFVGDFCSVCISCDVAEWGGGEEAKF